MGSSDGCSSSRTEESDVLSSSSGPSTSRSSSGADSPAPSPRRGGGSAPAAAAPPPGLSLRVPSLSLRANLALLPRGGGPGDAPATARQPRATAADEPLASARGCQPLAAPAAARPATPPQPQPSSQAALLSLDILSPAFGLEKQQEREQLGRSCAGRLGVPPERLRFYALTEVEGAHQLPPGCSRAAVEVLDSRFSLSALEELLADNKRLAAAEQQQHLGGPAATAASAPAPEQQLRKLQLENEALRQQLKLSESLRRKGQKVLRELKQEFGALSRELILGSGSALEFAEGKNERAQAVGTPVAVADGLL